MDQAAPEYRVKCGEGVRAAWHALHLPTVMSSVRIAPIDQTIACRAAWDADTTAMVRLGALLLFAAAILVLLAVAGEAQIIPTVRCKSRAVHCLSAFHTYSQASLRPYTCSSRVCGDRQLPTCNTMQQ